MTEQPERRSPRDEHIAQRMHEDFKRDRFIPELKAFNGLRRRDDPTREHFAAYDRHRKWRFGREFDEQQRERQR